MYPVNLILDDKPCVVLGGGHVALRKVEGLLEAKAKITIISPEIVAELSELVMDKRITWIKRCYEQGDLANYYLAICAIGNEEINKQVQKEANANKVILNVVDRLEYCDFALPAKIRRGDLLVTFSTNGKSPALAKYLRCKMESEFDDTYAKWLDKLVELRKEAIAKLPTSDDREIFWRSALSDEVMNLVKAKEYNKAEGIIKDAINSFRVKS